MITRWSSRWSSLDDPLEEGCQKQYSIAYTCIYIKYMRTFIQYMLACEVTLFRQVPQMHSDAKSIRMWSSEVKIRDILELTIPTNLREAIQAYRKFKSEKPMYLCLTNDLEYIGFSVSLITLEIGFLRSFSFLGCQMSDWHLCPAKTTHC